MQPASSGPPPVPGWTPPSGPSGPRAGFGARFGAWFVDLIPLMVVGASIGEAIGQKVVTFTDGIQYQLTGQPLVLTLLLGTIYFTVTEGGRGGQTLGKKLAGIRVIDFNTGGAIGYGRALLRQLGKLLSFFFLGLGFLWMLWDGQKQTWGDKMATSIVVPISAYPIR